MKDALFPHWRRRVAVKVLSAGFGEIGRREAAVLALLQQTPAASVFPLLYGVLESGPHYCIFMEACGPSLSAVIRSGPAPEAYVRRVATQLLAALACMRRLDVIHADVKPDNVLLARDDGAPDVKLIDYGNAIRPHEALRYFDDFEIQTFGYRAPEVLAGLPFSFGIDTFSAGVVLVELSNGEALLDPAVATRASASAKLEEVLGRLPRRRFAGAKFYSTGVPRESPQSRPMDEAARRRAHLRNVRRRLIGTCATPYFASFAAQLLELDPDHRPDPQRALRCPFLAAEFPFAAVFGDPPA